MYKVNCIKCKQEYESEEEDAYYCPPCLEIKNKIAKEIDAKIKPNYERGMTNLERYDFIRKTKGRVNINQL